MRGTMIWFNADKGHGFIRTEDDERLIVHEDGFSAGEIPAGRCAGTAPTASSAVARQSRTSRYARP